MVWLELTTRAWEAKHLFPLPPDRTRAVRSYEITSTSQ